MLLAVIVAVTWPSGAQVAELKENVGPWFLNAIGKDVVLNLIMLLPPGLPGDGRLAQSQPPGSGV